MIRAVLCLLLCLAAPAVGQGVNVLARVDVQGSQIADTRGGAVLELTLSQGVPFRVFTLDGPPRLVVDFQDVSFDGVEPSALLNETGRIQDVRFGPFQPGWSRLVADLTGPMLVETVGMPVDPDTGQAQLNVTLRDTDADKFASAVRPPNNDAWTMRAPTPVPPINDDAFVVVIDPGHGGVDPGASRAGLVEKELMLEMGLGLRDALRRTGMAEVILTRDRDVFVSLKTRVAIAHQMRADLIVSLHADTVAQGHASGATVYTLSSEASDAASALLAQQHNRADLIAGLDLSSADDGVTAVLMSLARQETRPRTDLLADTLIDHMRASGGPVNRHPRRQADFSVLRSADIPSVLIEVGFMSDARDVANLRNPEWRDGMVAAIARGILDWHAQDLANRALVRQ